MKKLFNLPIRIGVVIALFFLNYSIMYGQFKPSNDFFITYPSLVPEIHDTSNYSADTVYDFENAEPKVFNVYFYGLELTNGYTDPYNPLTEEMALERIARLNIAFNPFKIFFKYRGIEHYSALYENPSDPDDPHNGTEVAILPKNKLLAWMENISDPNNINFVFHRPGTCQNDYGYGSIGSKTILFRYCKLNPTYFVHQMGHMFGLLNTYYGTGYSPQSNAIPQEPPCNEEPYDDILFTPNFTGIPENVTRDENNAYYNADVAGDMVVDTPASFRGAEDNYCHSYYPNTTYEFLEHPSIVDNSPEHLMYVDVDMFNIMTFTSRLNRDHFTNGQGVRMRETIEISTLNFAEVETTVASLFEPYKEVFDPLCNTNNTTLDYYFSEIPDEDPRDIDLESGLTYRSIDPNIPRGCIVSYFQPGFDYEVYWCRPINIQGDWEVGDLYCVYDKESYIIPMISLGAKVIKIVQLDQYGACNHPFIDSIRAVGGSIYTHGNTTYEADPLDSIQINNSNFLFSLPNGIHTIKVQTNENEIIEKTIIKQ